MVISHLQFLGCPLQVARVVQTIKTLGFNKFACIQQFAQGIQLFQSERLESPRVFFSFGVSATSKDAPLIPKANSSVTSAAMMIVTIDYGVVAIVAKWVDF